MQTVPPCAPGRCRLLKRLGSMTDAKEGVLFAGIGAVAALWPRVPRAQQLLTPVIGYLSGAPRTVHHH